MDGPFSVDYSEARAKFAETARSQGAAHERIAHPMRGPDGSDLSVDIAWFGDRKADKVFVALSGTHGVEGFFGSAVQVEWMRRGEQRRLPEGAAALLVHAINPFGFAWLRRTNEDNVDLNRNWIDFAAGRPANPQYDEMASDLCPSDWSDATRQETGARLAAWRDRHGGMPAYLQAVTGGQWAHPKGLFFGGHAPTWSRITLTDIVTSHLGAASRVTMVDFHTGLGPFGYAEPIIDHRIDDPAFVRTRNWIGASAKSLHGGSISAVVHGDGMSAMPALLPGALVDAVSLECGVQPIDKVETALRAENWLHAHGDPASSGAAEIKGLIRAAFHSDDPFWQGMALGQGLAACRAAVGGLSIPAA